MMMMTRLAPCTMQRPIHHRRPNPAIKSYAAAAAPCSPLHLQQPGLWQVVRIRLQQLRGQQPVAGTDTITIADTDTDSGSAAVGVTSMMVVAAVVAAGNAVGVAFPLTAASGGGGLACRPRP